MKICFDMNSDLEDKIFKFFRAEVSSKHGFFFSLLLGFLIRLAPELLSYPNIIGFDTLRYAVDLKESVIWYHWSNIFTHTWLLKSLIIPIHRIIQSPIITLKIASTMLYGLNVAGIYYFANKTLKWKTEKSLLTSLLFSFSIASLRISWDLYRNTLGLGILLFALSLIPEIRYLRIALGFIFLSMLTVFSHELTAASLFFMVILFVLREMRESNKAEALRILVPSLPALIIFLLGVYLGAYPIKYEIKTNVIGVPEIFEPHPLGLFFLTNYLSVSAPVEHYSTYPQLALHITSLFALLYVIWLPIIIKGFFRDKILDAWTALLLAGSFGPLIIPFCSLLYWNRWMFMLVYPFTFYAVNGIEKFHTKPRLKWPRNITKGIIIATILIGILFTALPSNLAPFYTPLTCLYLPSSMQQNTIPLEDVAGTIECLEWLNVNMNQNSSVLVHHAFLYWARLYLDNNHTIIYYAMNLTKAVEVAQQNGFRDIYLIWWKDSIGWYLNIKVPEDFEITHSRGRISIYKYAV